MPNAFSGPCPCAVPNSKLVGNVLLNEKCYLWYSNTSLYTFNQMQTMCTNPTGTTCADNSGPCITSGVGRMATFDTWTDYSAVSTAFNAPCTAEIQIGVGCSGTLGSNGAGFSYDPFGDCAPSPIVVGSANWPIAAFFPTWPMKGSQPGVCSALNPYVTIWYSWITWMPNVGGDLSNYICEAGKNDI